MRTWFPLGQPSFSEPAAQPANHSPAGGETRSRLWNGSRIGKRPLLSPADILYLFYDDLSYA